MVQSYICLFSFVRVASATFAIYRGLKKNVQKFVLLCKINLICWYESNNKRRIKKSH